MGLRRVGLSGGLACWTTEAGYQAMMISVLLCWLEIIELLHVGLVVRSIGTEGVATMSAIM